MPLLLFVLSTGTQNIFFADRNVMYISLHRHDEGKFYPFTGGPDECGEGEGLGYNVNIAWAGVKMACWRKSVLFNM